MAFSLFPAALAAQTVGASNASPATSGMMSTIIIIGFMAIFYFMLWRPQMKRTKEHQQLISNLQKDDEVITNGGVLGRIIKIADQFIVIEIAPQTEITLQKQAVASVVPKGTLKAIKSE